MPRFFVDNAAGDRIIITGDDAGHISRSLRMKPGERLTVCDGLGSDMECVIDSLTDGAVYLSVESVHSSETEPTVKVTLYQGYPKGDKLETVIQKSVELGVHKVVPVITERSVARPDGKSAAKKLERLKRHSLEAAKQCGRGIIPEVCDICEFADIQPLISAHELCIFCYEQGGEPLRALIGDGTAHNIGLFIGPEGGIAEREAELLTLWGAKPATLGSRILRTETAPIAALAVIMELTGNFS